MIDESTFILADKGDQGIIWLHKNSLMQIKKYNRKN